MRSKDFAARRMWWLAELAEALEEACTLLKQLSAAEDDLEAAELYARIEAVRAEVEAIRLSAPPRARQDFGPEWSKDNPWTPRP
jgi:hypothetical protein